jgi:hypothetical protein
MNAQNDFVTNVLKVLLLTVAQDASLDAVVAPPIDNVVVVGNRVIAPLACPYS